MEEKKEKVTFEELSDQKLESITLDTNEGDITLTRKSFDFLFVDKNDHLLYRAQNGNSLVYSLDSECYFYKNDNKRRKLKIYGVLDTSILDS